MESRHDYIDGAIQLVWVELREFGKVRAFRVGLGPSARSTNTLHIVETRHLPKAYLRVQSQRSDISRMKQCSGIKRVYKQTNALMLHQCWLLAQVSTRQSWSSA